MDVVNPRKADHPIDPMFTARWSPRAYTGEPVPEADLKTMFEAARWAPSSSNSQPWRYLYARAGTPHFETFLHLLNESNQVWAKTAGALVILVSKEAMETGDKIVPMRTHALDVGTSWGFLALQAMRLGYMTHAMAGVNLEKTRDVLRIPAGYSPQIAIAIGKQADAATLSERQREREVPNARRPQTDFVFEGGFPER
jgi:nitroreductase